ncbi:MAG: hypothetical protein MAG453_01869 [Calditrichaeota bacterium]|nr:hypothetical protein [Calditrichota bacterium]
MDAQESVRLVEASAGHIDQVVLLWRELIGYHERLDGAFTMQAGAERIFRDFALGHVEDEHAFVTLAFVADEPAGYIMVRVEALPPVFVRDRCALIQDLVVSERFRRRGIGRRLTRVAIEWARRLGLDTVQLQVATLNGPGVDFWHAMGFHEHLKLMRMDLDDPETRERRPGEGE